MPPTRAPKREQEGPEANTKKFDQRAERVGWLRVVSSNPLGTRNMKPKKRGNPAMGDYSFSRADGHKEGVQPGWGAEGIGGAVTDALRSTASAVSAQASDLVSSVSEEVVSAADQQKERGADAMKSVARAIGGAAENLNAQSPAIAKRLRSAAHAIESLSDTVKDRSLRELSHEATGLAKRQPIAFFTGAVVAGFALARFLKSSAPAVPHAISADSSHQSNPAE